LLIDTQLNYMKKKIEKWPCNLGSRILSPYLIFWWESFQS